MPTISTNHTFSLIIRNANNLSSFLEKIECANLEDALSQAADNDLSWGFNVQCEIYINSVSNPIWISTNEID